MTVLLVERAITAPKGETWKKSAQLVIIVHRLSKTVILRVQSSLPNAP